MKKEDWARLDYFDQWTPDLAPSAELVRFHQQERPIGDKRWKAFATRYRREMATPERQRLIAMLARLSHTGNFSVGCYCEDGKRCHRSLLEALLRAQGADVAEP